MSVHIRQSGSCKPSQAAPSRVESSRVEAMCRALSRQHLSQTPKCPCWQQQCTQHSDDDNSSSSSTRTTTMRHLSSYQAGKSRRSSASNSSSNYSFSSSSAAAAVREPCCYPGNDIEQAKSLVQPLIYISRAAHLPLSLTVSFTAVPA